MIRSTITRETCNDFNKSDTYSLSSSFSNQLLISHVDMYRSYKCTHSGGVRYSHWFDRLWIFNLLIRPKRDRAMYHICGFAYAMSFE